MAALCLELAMRRQFRLAKGRDFAAVFREGRTWANRFLALRAGANGLGYNRYGFMVSRRLGKAVLRNKVRRRLRESARVLPTRPGWDIVISARTDAAKADYHELKKAVASLLARASILSANQDSQGDGNRS